MPTSLSTSDVLVRPAFVRTMAAYNAEMNRRIYAAAQRLPEIERQRQRGAFWGSIHGTLCHLLWGDQMWMSRFDGWAKPSVGLKDSPTLIGDFKTLNEACIAADERMSAWAERLGEDWLQQDLVWFSAAAEREICMPRSKLVVHFFNHHTHHRGQAHAMITAAGGQTGDTDLFLIV
jgi:uncharacterized damage-inducible protein DinB